MTYLHQNFVKMKKMLFLAALIAFASCQDSKKESENSKSQIEKISQLYKQRTDDYKAGNDSLVKQTKILIDAQINEAKKNLSGEDLTKFENDIKILRDEAEKAEISIDAQRFCKVYKEYMDANLQNDISVLEAAEIKKSEYESKMDEKYPESSANYNLYNSEFKICIQ